VTFQAWYVLSGVADSIDLGRSTSNRAHGSDDYRRKQDRLQQAPHGIPWTGHILDCVSGGISNSEWFGSGALDSSELISRFAEAGVAVFAS